VVGYREAGTFLELLILEQDVIIELDRVISGIAIELPSLIDRGLGSVKIKVLAFLAINTVVAKVDSQYIQFHTCNGG